MEKGKLSFWKSLGLAEWIAVGLAVAIVGSVGAIISPTIRAFFASSATAAWVQAIGVIVAVFVAMHVPYTQEKRAQDRLEEVRVSNIVGVLSLIREALDSLCFIVRRLEVVPRETEDPNRGTIAPVLVAFERSCETIQSIPFYSAPYGTLHHSLNPVLNYLREASAILPPLSKKLEKSPSIYNATHAGFSELGKQIDQELLALDKLYVNAMTEYNSLQSNPLYDGIPFPNRMYF